MLHIPTCRALPPCSQPPEQGFVLWLWMIVQQPIQCLQLPSQYVLQGSIVLATDHGQKTSAFMRLHAQLQAVFFQKRKAEPWPLPVS